MAQLESNYHISEIMTSKFLIYMSKEF